MNFTCVICAELFIPNEKIYFTQCGHVFHYTCLMNWMERSRSCPQCRCGLSEKSIHQVFFSFCNENSDLDATSLTYKLDNMNLTLSLKEKELKNVKEAKKKLEEMNGALERDIAMRDTEKKGLQYTLRGLIERVVHFKNKSKEVEVEILKLENKIKDMENIEMVLNGSREQVDDILKEGHNIEFLALLTVTLKKALVDSERQTKHLDYTLKRYKNEITKLKQKNSLLESQNAYMRREMQQIKIKTEKEKVMLKQRIKASEKKCTKSAFKQVDLLQDKKNSNDLPSSVNKNLEDLVASDLPYLPLKNNVGVFLKAKLKAPTTVTSSKSTNASSNKNYSLLNRNLTADKHKASTSKVAYDVLGGSSK
ncbi:E3 ubiquitin-protein ligase TRAIP-like isoform X1 [Diorhabda carinulata]|uniref:E3 ubiquitin-protein ligase TRAIP-like isoform X1 n=1 Tax=Diorhabda carinulata TaxID=1163345 RepID=UPI0025A11DA7|nr:E3 ubiquitin-protein ligase TRAIP-like isoform X1 [Diorhabda carinulata]